MDRRQLVRPRARRRLIEPMNMARAAIAIQAAARGFLARRRAARMGGRRRLLSPMDIKRKFQRAKKPTGQGQVIVPRVFPKNRIGSLVGTEKSKRPVTLKKLDPLEVKLHMDKTNTVLQGGVAYFGFPDAGSQDEQLQQGCNALVNMFFRRGGLKMTNIKSVINDQFSHLPDAGTDFYRTKLTKITILYVKWNADGTGFYSNSEHDVTITSSIETVATSIFNSIKSKGVDDGQWPLMAKLHSTSLKQYATPQSDEFINTFATYDLQNVMVDFAYMRKYKFQNVTPSDGSTGEPGARSTINDIAANPLSGRIYKFRGPTPLLRAAVQDQEKVQMPALDLIQQQGLGTLAHDYLDTRAFRYNAPDVGFNRALCVPFRQPFKAASVFKNTLTEDKVYMPPGGYKQLIRQGKVAYNFRRFCQATVFNSGDTAVNPGYIQPKTPKIGTSTLWGLEPAVRTVADENVKLIVNSELWMTCKCRVADKKQPVISNVKVEEGFNFQEEE